jgi:hypothetical protein
MTVAQLRSMLNGPRPVLADIKSVYAPAPLAAAGITVWRL